MVKFSVGPLHRIVTLFARRREAGVRDRSHRAVEILLMTSDAWQSAQRVIVVDVAIRALAGRNRVSTGQNESRGAVFKPRKIDIQPVVSGVTVLARGREFCADVARIGG